MAVQRVRWPRPQQNGPRIGASLKGRGRGSPPVAVKAVAAEGGGRVEGPSSSCGGLPHLQGEGNGKDGGKTEGNGKDGGKTDGNVKDGVKTDGNGKDSIKAGPSFPLQTSTKAGTTAHHVNFSHAPTLDISDDRHHDVILLERSRTDVSPLTPQAGEKPRDLLQRLYRMWPSQLSPSYRPHASLASSAAAELNFRFLRELHASGDTQSGLRRAKAAGVVVETVFHLGKKVHYNLNLKR